MCLDRTGQKTFSLRFAACCSSSSLPPAGPQAAVSADATLLAAALKQLVIADRRSPAPGPRSRGEYRRGRPTGHDGALLGLWLCYGSNLTRGNAWRQQPPVGARAAARAARRSLRWWCRCALPLARRRRLDLQPRGARGRRYGCSGCRWASRKRRHGRWSPELGPAALQPAGWPCASVLRCYRMRLALYACKPIQWGGVLPGRCPDGMRLCTTLPPCAGAAPAADADR